MPFVLYVIGNIVRLYSMVLVVYAVMSWLPGAYESKIGQIAIRLSEPYINLFRRLPLQFGGIDFSVVFALLSLQWIQAILVRFASMFIY